MEISSGPWIKQSYFKEKKSINNKPKKFGYFNN